MVKNLYLQEYWVRGCRQTLITQEEWFGKMVKESVNRVDKYPPHLQWFQEKKTQRKPQDEEVRTANI